MSTAFGEYPSVTVSAPTVHGLSPLSGRGVFKIKILLVPETHWLKQEMGMHKSIVLGCIAGLAGITIFALAHGHVFHSIVGMIFLAVACRHFLKKTRKPQPERQAKTIDSPESWIVTEEELTSEDLWLRREKEVEDYWRRRKLDRGIDLEEEYARVVAESEAVDGDSPPEVNRKHAEPPRHIPSDVKARVWERDNGRCVMCRATNKLHFDHIIPVAKGGGNSVDNIQILCQTCNLKKSDKIL